MNLKDELKKLVELQEIDSRIYSLQHQKDQDKPAQIEALRNAFEEKKRRLQSFEQELQQLQLKKKEKELDLASKEEGVRKAQGQLYQLKTNKEYHAKLSEIESLKADVSVIEEDILKVMEEIEQAQGRMNEAKGVLSGQEKEFKEVEVRLSREIKEIESEIAQHQTKRKVIAETVDRQILSRYEQLLQSRGGRAAAPVINENCGACHMRMTAQTINEIKMYDELKICSNCVRILYIQEDFE
ncbi:MAG: hypothetical protein JXD21_06705 [Candidatus Omnitrophica bacterium]|nr:hypothetical protein [Candidatus Omnitrophota bacterium]